MAARFPAVLIAVLFLVGVLGIPGAAESDYSISVVGNVDTPQKTVTIEDDRINVSAVAKVDQGETISATIDAPTDTSYRVNLYGIQDGKRVIVDSRYIEADDPDSVEFDTATYDPGSYALAVYHDGEYQAFHPVIVSENTVSITADATVERGEAFNPEISVTTLAKSTEVESVELILVNESFSKRVTASSTREQTYQASITTDGLNTGTYRVYAVVLNNSLTPEENYEPIGLSPEQTVDITAETTTTTTSKTLTTTTSSTNTADTTTSTTQNTTKTSSVTTTVTSTSTSTTGLTSTSNTTTQASDRNSTTTGETTTSEAITPNKSTSTLSTTSSTNVPGFSFAAIVVALLAATGLLRRR